MRTASEILSDAGIQLMRAPKAGNQRTLCPRCSHQRKKKVDPCLSVEVRLDGVRWRCWNSDCEWHGGAFLDGHLVAKPNGFRRSARLARADDNFRRSAQVLPILRDTRPSDGTLVETYFASRALRLPPPLTLRFHDGLKHPSGGIWPAMIALVTRGADGTPLAIHRTFLARDGSGKAPVDPQKMMLGPCRGGAVRLAEPGDVLMVGEGIETCLAAMQAAGLPAWAALSTSGLRALELPENVRDVIVLADGDDPGEAAARACAIRWRREGRRVRIARPPQGLDFNDLLVRCAPRIGERAL